MKRRKGMEALQIAILMSIVALAATLLGQAILSSRPNIQSKGVADVILVMKASTSSGCSPYVVQYLENEYHTKIRTVSVQGSLNLTIFMRVLSPGTLDGVKIYTNKGLMIITFNKITLQPSYYLLCIVPSKPVSVMVDPNSLELLGMTTLR